MIAEEIRELVEKTLVGTTAYVTGDDTTNFSIVVVGDVFVNKTRVEQQKMVYGVLADKIINGDIHALELKTYTETTWREC